MAERKTQEEYVSQVNDVNPNFDIISQYVVRSNRRVLY